MDVPCSIQGNIHVFSLIKKCVQDSGYISQCELFFDFCLSAYEVELDLAEMACVSRNVRTTRSESLLSISNSSHCEEFSNVPFLSARSRITQWFIDFLSITRDSRKSNKLCGRKTTKQKNLTL